MPGVREGRLLPGPLHAKTSWGLPSAWRYYHRHAASAGQVARRVNETRGARTARAQFENAVRGDTGRMATPHSPLASFTSAARTLAPPTTPLQARLSQLIRSRLDEIDAVVRNTLSSFTRAVDEGEVQLAPPTWDDSIEQLRLQWMPPSDDWRRAQSGVLKALSAASGMIASWEGCHQSRGKPLRGSPRRKTGFSLVQAP
jgi:hypothetical protein